MPVGAVGAIGSIGAPALFSGAASLGAGALGYFGAQKAAGQQAAGQQQALQMFAPYAQMGQGALQSLSSLYGLKDGSGQFNQGVLNNMPGYDWSKHQILQATDFGDSARGRLISSANLLQRQKDVGNVASENYTKYVNPLLTMAGIGAGGAQGAAGALTGYANAQAGGTVGGFNALGAGIGQAGNNYMLASLLNNNQNKSAFGGGGAYTPQQFNQMYQATPPSFGGSGGFGGSYVP